MYVFYYIKELIKMACLTVNIISKKVSSVSGALELWNVKMCVLNYMNKNKFGNNLLHVFANEGDEEMLAELLACGCDVNLKNKNGETSLHSAMLNGHIECVKLLCLQEKIDVNAKDKYGTTALHWASRNGHGECVKLLCSQRKININLKNNEEWTPLHYASYEGNIECVKVLCLQKKNKYEFKN